MSEATGGIAVSGRVVVPASAMKIHFVRASGPGGQNVNKVATKAEIVVDVLEIIGLTDAQRSRLTAAASGRLDKSGCLHVVSQRTRSQQTNVQDAREKVRKLIESALRPPKARVATRPSKASKERRLDAKRRVSRKKENRRARDE
jgi:ribosome-associated protein